MVTVANIDNKYVKMKQPESVQRKIISVCDGSFGTLNIFGTQKPNISS